MVLIINIFNPKPTGNILTKGVNIIKTGIANKVNKTVVFSFGFEKIKIERIDNKNCIHATVNNASFVGSSYQYILNSKLGKLYVISNDTNDVFEVGEEVFLNLNEKDIRVLND